MRRIWFESQDRILYYKAGSGSVFKFIYTTASSDQDLPHLCGTSNPEVFKLSAKRRGAN